MLDVRVDSHYQSQLPLRWKQKEHEPNISAGYRVYNEPNTNVIRKLVLAHIVKLKNIRRQSYNKTTYFRTQQAENTSVNTVVHLEHWGKHSGKTDTSLNWYFVIIHR